MRTLVQVDCLREYGPSSNSDLSPISCRDSDGRQLKSPAIITAGQLGRESISLLEYLQEPTGDCSVVGWLRRMVESSDIEFSFPASP